MSWSVIALNEKPPEVFQGTEWHESLVHYEKSFRRVNPDSVTSTHEQAAVLPAGLRLKEWQKRIVKRYLAVEEKHKRQADDVTALK